MITTPNGVLPIDKPLGWTSFDVVAVARGVLGAKRVGHGGTLDPLATGLLPLLVGSATKFADRLHTASKVYAALVTFGAETTTDDREGSVTRDAAVPTATADALDALLGAFRGEIAQVPPAFAAVKVDGRRAYSRARSGETVELAARTVTIERIAIASWEPPGLRLLVVCSTGTYIRSLARDLGRAAGSAAHLGGLRRLAVGALTLDDALTVEVLRGTPDAQRRLRDADDRILPLAERFRVASAAELLSSWGRST
ncbi:MAG TPA: tRNA pseudouridine(55) synthase TruB [Candidatus Limnocylindria bacterium]|nr:tRNA pseudouridine(55) synthase TruB [Candidatus Limnocylindria bacterium]